MSFVTTITKDIDANGEFTILPRDLPGVDDYKIRVNVPGVVDATSSRITKNVLRIGDGKGNVTSNMDSWTEFSPVATTFSLNSTSGVILYGKVNDETWKILLLKYFGDSSMYETVTIDLTGFTRVFGVQFQRNAWLAGSKAVLESELWIKGNQVPNSSYKATFTPVWQSLGTYCGLGVITIDRSKYSIKTLYPKDFYDSYINELKFRYMTFKDDSGNVIYKQDLSSSTDISASVVKIVGDLGNVGSSRKMTMTTHLAHGLPSLSSGLLDGVCKVFHVVSEQVNLIVTKVQEVVAFIPQIVDGVTSYDFRKVLVGVDGICNLLLPEGAYVVVSQVLGYTNTFLSTLEEWGITIDTIITVAGWIFKIIQFASMVA